jgi:diguanylate cyclase (GGDEF)-like protein/PAS domain S-box-containing protein
MRILIADDDVTSRMMLQAMVTQWGFEPVVAEDGEAAWDTLQADNPPRLLLIDWEMPKLDGLQLCQRIREQDSEDPPYIILLTGRDEAEDIASGLGAGANDYLSKPFKKAELEARINVGRRLLKLQHEHIKALAEANVAASVFTHAREGIMITDAKGSIIRANDAFSKLSGYSVEEVLGTNSRFFAPEHHNEAWEQVLNTGLWAGEISNTKKNGDPVKQHLTVIQTKGANKQTQNYIGVVSDITERVQQREALKHAASHDPLTNLANRALLKDRLQQAMANVRRGIGPLALAFIDLDGFKAVNDKFGHDQGDQLLVNLSRNISELVRDTDTVARVGGDEFVVLLTGLTNNDGCESTLWRLLAAATTSLEIDGMQADVSASIGVSIFTNGDTVTEDELLQQADKAMYQAKSSGKNCYRFFDDRRIG